MHVCTFIPLCTPEKDHTQIRTGPCEVTNAWKKAHSWPIILFSISFDCAVIGYRSLHHTWRSLCEKWEKCCTFSLNLRGSRGIRVRTEPCAAEYYWIIPCKQRAFCMAQLVKLDSNTSMVSGLIPSMAEREKTTAKWMLMFHETAVRHSIWCPVWLVKNHSCPFLESVAERKICRRQERRFYRKNRIKTWVQTWRWRE